MTKVAIIVGSLRKESLNKKFAQAVEARLPEDVEVAHISVDLPLYNDDVEMAGVPEDVQAVKDEIASADGVLIISPEYNRGYSGVVKNALDWISRPYGDNSLNGKPVAVAGVSPSPLGTTQAQSQLRNVLLFLNTRIMGQPEMYVDGGRFFSEDGGIHVEAEGMLQSYVDAFMNHIKQ
ncbi:NAD(P)H-dependent oxidoreductase [Candidatus Saccharibacteria bacterium TM7i]|nr:NAD(P)H-dependent oxidoreductase [Candidatus Saccharibacteria bacterium TM7i]